MISFSCFVEVIPGPSCDDLFLILEITLQHLHESQDLGLTVNEREHDHTEGVLHLSVLEKLIQNNIRVGVVAELYDYAHTFAVRLIAQIRDTIDALCFDKLCDLLDERRLVYKIGQFRNDDTALAVRHSLDTCDRTDEDLASAGAIRLNCT